MPIQLPFLPRRRDYPPDLWTKCPSCEEMLYNKQLDRNLRVCPKCGHHFRLRAAARIRMLLDPDSFVERDAGLESLDPLGFTDQKSYPDRLATARVATGLSDAAVWGLGRIEGLPVVACVMDFAFMGGSFGSVVGEKVARAAEAALEERVPLVIVSASGGARMQEGTVALMQLAKTCAALKRLSEARVPYISILTDPTTGGCWASWASLGDVNLAEPNALIGFAGARVAGGTIGAEFPPGFQRAEFVLEHGFADQIVPRDALRATVATVLAYLHPDSSAVAAVESRAGVESGRELPWPFGFLAAWAGRDGDGRSSSGPSPSSPAVPSPASPAAPSPSSPPAATVPEAPAPVPGPAAVSNGPPGASPTSRVLAPPDASDAAAAQESVWARVRAARNVKRPHTLELIRAMATDVVELHGDRLFGDDPAVVGGLARLRGRRFVFVGHQKGSETEENVRRNFGMAHPEGYRKAMRLFAMAERFGLPIVTIVDTPGAHPDAESEERGIAEAIARAIMEMSGLRTPVVTVITGEGGSGGALGIAVGDVVLALENAVYSVISPEGCASILWRDASVAPRAAVAMRITAAEQSALGVVDEVVPEPAGGAQEDPVGLAAALARRIAWHLEALAALTPDELVDRRYARYRNMGSFREVETETAPPARKPDLAGRLRELVEAGIEAGRAALGGPDGQPQGARAPAAPEDVEAPLRPEP